MPQSMSLGLQTFLLLLPWLGFVLLFFASALMPVIVERLAFSHLIGIMPGARVKLALSAVATGTLLALLTAAAATVAFLRYPVEIALADIFRRAFIVSFVNFGLMYAAIWLVSKARGVWLLVGAVLIVLGLILPLGLIGYPGTLPPLIWVGAVGWLALVGLLLGGRASHWLGAARPYVAPLVRGGWPSIRYAAGTEVELLLGTMRPWLPAVGQIVPIGVVSWFIRENSAWLLCLVLIGAVSATHTAQAAARSRRLWLKLDWTRAEVFRQIEAAYWRHDAWALAVRVLLFVAIGSYFDLGTPFMSLGIVLLVLGTLASSYLGLVATGTLAWLEVVLVIVTMGLMVLAAITIAAERVPDALAIMGVLGAAAMLYRRVAKARWSTLDWTGFRVRVTARRAA